MEKRKGKKPPFWCTELLWRSWLPVNKISRFLLDIHHYGLTLLLFFFLQTLEISAHTAYSFCHSGWVNLFSYKPFIKKQKKFIIDHFNSLH